ncbi:MAG: ADP-L-glycero-D-manno-heptose 6-epimerase [Candidatus Omnitrophota bacterium]|jgi:ADP-L-glycero-D-manno-heptose 6-epimerase
MILVTGAAGFIGSCIVAGLNELGREDIIVVDDYVCTKQFSKKGNDLKKFNLQNKKFIKFIDKDLLLEKIESNELSDVKCVIHMGACSSTTIQDEIYFEDNNFLYTKSLAEWALAQNVRFIYASSAATYGDGSIGYNDDETSVRKCEPLNLYGASKQKFDEWVLDNNLQDKLVGLKFFNVFGPNEYHKEGMRSVVAKSFDRVVEEGKISLFKSYKEEYGDGEQKRDFVYVKDVVEVIFYLMNHNDINGIFNVGTGQARTWKDLAYALFAAVGKEPDIEYVDMPDILQDKYQYFTEASIQRLRDAGYTKPFTSLEDAVKDYAQYLKDKSYW